MLNTAGEEGTTEDKYTMGVMYSEGRSVPEDAAKAREWFEKAAAGGHVLAQFNLAVMYSEGLGEARDAGKAIFWAEKAVAQGDQQATELLADLRNGKTRQQKAMLENLLLTGSTTDPGEDVQPPSRLRIEASAESGHESQTDEIATLPLTGSESHITAGAVANHHETESSPATRDENAQPITDEAIPETAVVAEPPKPADPLTASEEMKYPSGQTDMITEPDALEDASENTSTGNSGDNSNITQLADKGEEHSGEVTSLRQDDKDSVKNGDDAS